MKGGPHVAGRILRDVPEAAQLGGQLVELRRLRELPVERLEEVEEMLGLNTACLQELE